jgi:hypothetical protein
MTDAASRLLVSGIAFILPAELSELSETRLLY